MAWLAFVSVSFFKCTPFLMSKEKLLKIRFVVAWWQGKKKMYLKKQQHNKDTAGVLPSWEDLASYHHIISDHIIASYLIISILIWLCTLPSSCFLSLFFVFSSLVLGHSHTAVWWEDQGLQRGWITQSEYQQCRSVLVCQLSGRLFSLSLEAWLTAGVASWHTALGNEKW